MLLAVLRGYYFGFAFFMFVICWGPCDVLFSAEISQQERLKLDNIIKAVPFVLLLKMYRAFSAKEASFRNVK